jgi:hypothetical protein
LPVRDFWLFLLVLIFVIQQFVLFMPYFYHLNLSLQPLWSWWLNLNLVVIGITVQPYVVGARLTNACTGAVRGCTDIISLIYLVSEVTISGQYNYVRYKNKVSFIHVNKFWQPRLIIPKQSSLLYHDYSFKECSIRILSRISRKFTQKFKWTNDSVTLYGWNIPYNNRQASSNFWQVWWHTNCLLVCIPVGRALFLSINIVAYLCHARTVTLKHIPAITQQ